MVSKITEPNLWPDPSFSQTRMNQDYIVPCSPVEILSFQNSRERERVREREMRMERYVRERDGERDVCVCVCVYVCVFHQVQGTLSVG